MPTLDEAFLDDRLAELERLRGWSPRVVSKLESFLRSDDEWALFRANPYAFAEERGVNADEAVDLFLLASKVGLVQMTWSLLCPGCGAAVQSFASLKSVCASFHCALCSVDVETSLDEYVHVGFTVSPRVRAIPAHDPQALPADDLYFRWFFTREARLARGGDRFVELLRKLCVATFWLEPGETRSVDLTAETGLLAAYEMSTGSQFVQVIDATRTEPNAPIHNKVGSARALPVLVDVAPGPLTLVFENDTAQRGAVMIHGRPQAIVDEYQARLARGQTNNRTFDPFLSGRRLLTSHTFRQAFGTEIIKASDGIGVRDVSILFTDLKGSTALYDRIGDLRAFALVNQHFDRLSRAITRHHGAVVKTIGDAVMASFETPADAVSASVDMLREISTFNDEVGEKEIVLKIGVHRGASIAVTLNDRLDFFGQTVNIAARVQGLADADEIYITEDVYSASGVKEQLRELHVAPRQANLKGVQRCVNVFRIASTPAPADWGASIAP
jgi:class 3 adenylate cyclase